MLTRMYTQRNVSDLLNEYFETPRVSNQFNTPAANILEHKDEFIVELAVPGLKKDDLKVELNKGSLIIYSEAENKEEDKFITNEFNYGSFRKVYYLNEKIDTTKISASYSEGIFKVILPKKEEAIDRGPVQIEIA